MPNIDEATGALTLNTNQQAILRKAKNIIEIIMKVDPKVVNLHDAVEKYCDKESGEAK